MATPAPAQMLDRSPARRKTRSLTPSTEQSYGTPADDRTDSASAGDTSPGTPAETPAPLDMRRPQPRSAHPSVMAVHGSAPSSLDDLQGVVGGPAATRAFRQPRTTLTTLPQRADPWDKTLPADVEVGVVDAIDEAEENDAAAYHQAPPDDIEVEVKVEAGASPVAEAKATGAGLGDVPADWPALRKFEAARIAKEAKEVEEAIAKLMETAPAKPNHRVIAVDFDEIIALNNKATCDKHNEVYGTDISADEMHSHSHFQNRGWGTPAGRKIHTFYNLLPIAFAVPGVVAGLRALRALGHPLHIVTARRPNSLEFIVPWLAERGVSIGLGDDDLIAAAWFTGPPVPDDVANALRLSYGREQGASKQSDDELNAKMLAALQPSSGDKWGSRKLKVIRAINASLLIDDTASWCVDVASAEPPVPCLVFGNYPWNRHIHEVVADADCMSFDERVAAGLELSRRDVPDLPELGRAANWADVVAWVKRSDEEALL